MPSSKVMHRAGKSAGRLGLDDMGFLTRPVWACAGVGNECECGQRGIQWR